MLITSCLRPYFWNDALQGQKYRTRFSFDPYLLVTNAGYHGCQMKSTSSSTDFLSSLRKYPGMSSVLVSALNYLLIHERLLSSRRISRTLPGSSDLSSVTRYSKSCCLRPTHGCAPLTHMLLIQIQQTCRRSTCMSLR